MNKPQSSGAAYPCVQCGMSSRNTVHTNKKQYGYHEYEAEPEPKTETPILDELEGEAEHDQQLYLDLASKVAFWTMVAGHLLMRLEAVDPASSVKITPKMKNVALGLPIQLGMSSDETGDIYHLYLTADKESVKLVRNDEIERRKSNGIGIEVIIRVPEKSRAEPASGIIGLDGKELPTSKPREAAGTGSDRTPGEIS